jgi:putative tryptophan/tyrosine transport system substrate-binding protein
MVAQLAAALLVCAASFAVQGQQAQKIYRVGFVTTASPGSGLDLLRQGLKESGYVEGRNVVIDARFAAGRQDRVARLVDEVLAQKPDVIVVVSTRTALAAKNATSTIPVVFASVFDPVAAGLVASLARPGGNVTGSAMGVGGDFAGKWVELLKEAVPTLSHAAVLWNSANESSAQSAEAIRAAAQSLNVKLELFDAATGTRLDWALKRIASSRFDGMIIAPDPYFNASRSRLVRFAASQRLPAVYFFRSFADAGGLMAYGANNASSIHASAKYVDRILRGAKPGELPVDQPTRFDLVINLKAAKTLGLTIPQSLIVRADELID